MSKPYISVMFFYGIKSSLSIVTLTDTHVQIIQINHNRIKNPNWQEATSWLLSMAEDFNLGRQRTNAASRQSGTQTWGCRIMSPMH